MIGPKPSWKKTLHLPKSTFPARAQAGDLPKYIKRCTDDLYAWQRTRHLAQRFTLHDGPPYANGDLHIGHALNKILKDIICRSRLADHVIDWRPGWDCHGLPIELKALQQHGGKTTCNAVGIRAAAEKLATKTVQNQKKAFQRWGIMSDWDNAWTTMDKEFEIKQLAVFQKMAWKGLIYRRFKPVYWSPSSQTALAEAELEYRDDHVSTAVYIKYPLHTIPPGLASKLGIGDQSISAVIWTTTSWTLPANRAIGINVDVEYTVAESASYGRLLVANSRLAEVQNHLNETLRPLASIGGRHLLGVSYSDPTFGSRPSPRPFLHAGFVTESSGSGLVHFAPGHGMDEYLLCLSHGIVPFAPVDDNGCFTILADPTDSAQLLGKEVLGNGIQAVLKLLSERGQLLGQHEYTHKYPYDWRSKKPVIVRATEQWFANVGNIQGDALQALESVQFIPSTSAARLRAFVKNRSEWCISRQRAWGVPIPALYHRETNEALLSDGSVSHIISMIRQRGINAWWTDDEIDPAWTPPDLRNSDGQTSYRRGKDTMDVWFDSGTSWTQTQPTSNKDHHIADCYIEGTDQHRGWFQSSLLTHVAHQQNPSTKENPPKAPFNALITHGFTLDQAGRKMSKSIGNVISPEEIIDGTLLPATQRHIIGKPTTTHDAMGPDALRLWVASCDYTSDVKISQQTLQTITSTLSKYRVTFKLILGILSDYQPQSPPLPTQSLQSQSQSQIHTFALHRLSLTTFKVRHHYHLLEPSKAVSEITKYITTDLSATYFEQIKDLAYCGTPSDRLSVQQTLRTILSHLQEMLLPILPILVEEVWDYSPTQIKEFENQIPPARRPRLPLPLPLETNTPINPEQLQTDFTHLSTLTTTLKTLQEHARSQKKMGDSLQSYICISMPHSPLPSPQPHSQHFFHRYPTPELEIIFGVSKVTVVVDEEGMSEVTKGAEWYFDSEVEIMGEKVRMRVYEPQGAKCERCWRYTVPDEKEEGKGEGGLCVRCEGVVGEMRRERPELFV